MFKNLFTCIVLSALVLLLAATEISLAQPKKAAPAPGGTLEKMLVSNGVVTMNLDLAGSKATASRFTVTPDSFFTLLVFNNDLRGPEPSSMSLSAQDAATLPAALKGSQLAIEKLSSDQRFEFVIKDAKTGLAYFNVEGHSYDYDAAKHLVAINDGRLLLAGDFARKLGRQTGTAAGTISVKATVVPIEVVKMVDGEVVSAVMPPRSQPDVGTVPGPDVIVGDLPSVVQPNGGSAAGFIGVGIGTTSCNAGTVNLNWFRLPDNDHPVIPQNMYRMSGGASNNDRFEQIGQSWLKHAFTALTQNACGFGCNGTGGDQLGSGCSDPYDASLNYDQSRLGSRAWVNPFTGVYPRGDSAQNPNSHTNHTHTGTSHRCLIASTDLNTTLNVGATYFAEGQYVTPHEYVHCQSNPGQCNMNNNVSYRRFTVTGTTGPYTFSPAAATVRQKAAIEAWTGATINQFQPAPGVDGIGMVGYKVTNPSAGVYHYEYAVYNQNLDRAIQSFSVPLGCGVTASNLGFHAPPQPAAFLADGTQNNTGYSSATWATNQTVSALTWSSETFTQNENANALRWGTLYNFRFDSNKPPQAAQATIGFYKTGTPITVNIQAPTPDPCTPLAMNSVVSRKDHDGFGVFDIDLPLTGTPGLESRTTSGAHTFVFTFSNNLSAGNASVTAGTGTVAGRTLAGNTMSVDLTGVADQQQITVTATGVMDTFGQTMADTPVNAIVLMGDTTANQAVNASDVAQTKGAIGAAVDATNFRTDVNANGIINSADLGQVKSNVGKSFP